MLGTIQVGAEPYPIFCHAAQGFQAHHLEAAAVGEDGMRPRHKAMQPAGVANQFMPGTKIKMIGVGQQDLDAQRFQFLLPHALDGTPRAHGHEHGRLHRAVGGVQQPGPRARDLVFSDDFKPNGHAF